MIFESPVWLLGLLPWGVVVMYLLPGRGRAVVVPFLRLWKDTSLLSRPMARRWPPLWILFALMALLLMVLAAAEPGVGSANQLGDGVTIVLDRGATMSLSSASGKPFRAVIDRCVSQLGPIGDRVRVVLVPVPGPGMELKNATWAAAAARLSPTAMRTDLNAVLSGLLRQTNGRVLVLTDQQLSVRDPRIQQIYPEPAGPLVAIIAMGASVLPHPQVMLRVENHSDQSAVWIDVQSDDAVVRKSVTLPPRGSGSNQFFDLPSLSTTVHAWIENSAQPDPWSEAFLVLQSDGIRIRLDPAVDAGVRRLADLYSTNRPAGQRAREVVISTSALDLNQSGIWIDRSAATGTAQMNPTVVAHPLTQNVIHWPACKSAVMPIGFSPVVFSGNVVMVARREDPARQVWVNLDLQEWQKTADFVVFFANALDWIAGESQSYTSIFPADLGEEWKRNDNRAGHGEWPGIYESKISGRQVAVNAGAFWVPGDGGGAPVKMTGQIRAGGRRSIANEFIFASLGFLLLAVLVW